MFGSRIRLKSLSLICRSLGTMLDAGVDVKKALTLASTKTGDPRARRAMEEICDAVHRGEDISSAMRSQGTTFPELLIDMVAVAEQTGSLPEILKSLANHYENNLRMRRDFLSQIAWPVFQLVAAILIIAFVIFILGWIAERPNTQAEDVDVLGWGLLGTSGAITWLMGTFGSAAVLFVTYQVLVNSFQGKQFLDPLFMRIPVLGGCMRSFGIARFSWAYALTQQAGMPIEPSLDASLRATGNGAFAAAIPQIWGMVRAGHDLGDALAASRLFPREYVEIVHVAETSGTVPEELQRLSPQFEDEARRKMSALVAAISWLVWLTVATFIVFVIFSIFFWYLDKLQQYL